MLVYDLPDTIVSVQAEQAEKWGSTPEELMRIARKNSRHNYPFEVTPQKVGEEEILFAITEHFFTPNIILDLEVRPDLIGKIGSLVGIPTRNAAVIYKIDTVKVTEVIAPMVNVVYNMHADGPGSLTNSLYWYYEGIFEVIDYQLEEGKLTINASERFGGALNSLAS